MSADGRLLDALGELVSLGVGKAANLLNIMLDSHVLLSVPSLSILSAEELRGRLGSLARQELAAVEMGYSGGIEGSVELIFSMDDAGKLVDCLTGDLTGLEGSLDEIRAGTLAEVGNIVINAVLGTLANELDLALEYSVPAYYEGGIDRLIGEAGVEAHSSVLLVQTRFQVEELRVDGDIIVFFAVGSFENLSSAIERYTGA